MEAERSVAVEKLTKAFDIEQITGDKESLKRCIIKTLNLNNIERKLVVDKELEQSKKFDWSKEAEKMYKCTLQKADI